MAQRAPPWQITLHVLSPQRSGYRNSILPIIKADFTFHLFDCLVYMVGSVFLLSFEVLLNLCHHILIVTFVSSNVYLGIREASDQQYLAWSGYLLCGNGGLYR